MQDNIGRRVTLSVVIVEPEGNWIWDAHLTGKKHGLLITGIADGSLESNIERARKQIEDEE